MRTLEWKTRSNIFFYLSLAPIIFGLDTQMRNVLRYLKVFVYTETVKLDSSAIYLVKTTHPVRRLFLAQDVF